MARELDLSALDAANQTEPTVPGAAAKGYRRRRETNPTMQMSVRMREDVYERFRDLCTRERRTNGDMLEILLAEYLQKEKGGR